MWVLAKVKMVSGKWHCSKGWVWVAGVVNVGC